MIGRFLELSVQTDDILASVEFYERLGFRQLQVGETWSHPYAVLTDAPRLREVPAGRELCVAATGSTEVLWHAHAAGARPAMAFK